MEIIKRVQIIGMLQGILTKEAEETFIKNNKRPVNIETGSQIINEWNNYSASFTRMWLNYLPDSVLESYLQKKMAEMNNSGGINTLFGKM